MVMYVFWFFLYSFLGWLYESTICSMCVRGFMKNRGYLKGPCCPIYGFGAVTVIRLLGDSHNMLHVFFMAMLISIVLEFVISWTMEKMFHARWWDYSEYPLNVQGRICLYGCVIFGVASVILIWVIHPFVARLTLEIPSEYLLYFTRGAAILAAFDALFVTLQCMYAGVKWVFIKENVKYRIGG